MSKAERDRKENFKLSKGLMEENNRIFTDIVCYLRVSNISEEEQEEIISDILRMFLDWQEEDKSVESMVGKDYKKFSENIISAIQPKKSMLKTIKGYLGIIGEGFCIMFTIDFIFLYFPKFVKGNFEFNFTYDYTLAMLLRALITVTIACIFIQYIGKNTFEISKKQFSKLANFIFGCSLGGLMVLLILLSKLNHIVIFSVNIRYIIGAIVVYWVYKVVKKIIK
ncbi:hypothetical protein KPL39_03465 [Clostridium gasigenes]|uniref:hypothetical protein n=1 Tax=Clostridium gasigenes TaxID=94869 RepID=UPI001C0BA48B|nr:hypothetical protein [Clostridium gasigenes]MBU3135322.1 hypothetical protein [Clostridium gasigenes]